MLSAFTWLHTLLSLVGIGSGLVVVYGLLASKRLDVWTAIFLATTAATSVTGFLFPFHKFLPSHGVAILSLIILAIAILARYHYRLTGSWRRTYVITSIAALYLNVFVLILQLFLHVPLLKAAAPTQSEPLFQVTQLAALALFVFLAVRAAMRFRSGPHLPA